MDRFRTLLGLLLGLMLLVQGFAVSAAPHNKLSVNTPASASVMTDMPCHGQMAEAEADAEGKQPACCCDENCPDMTTCALGHLALVTPVTVSLPPATQAELHTAPIHIEARTLTSLLRPPIALHA